MYVANRHAYKKLSAVRLQEANILLAAKQWCGAYYLAGYAVECALKAKIADNLATFLPNQDKITGVLP